MLNKFIDGLCKALNAVIAVCLAAMVVLVFGNVVMRYGFNSGITLSEELSRWLFVWMTFMGAIVAVQEHGHLGSDMLVAKLGPTGQKICLSLSYLLMLWVCYLLFTGALAQTKINMGSTSAVMEVSMAWVYAPGVVFAVLAGVIMLIQFWRLLSGQTRDHDLILVKDTEESPQRSSSAE